MARLALLTLCWLFLAPLTGDRTGDEKASEPQTKIGGLEGSRAMIILLHGGSFSGARSDELATRALAEVTSAARRARLRVVVPVAPASAESAAADGTPVWLTAEGEAAVLDLLEAERHTRRHDPSRVYLAGQGAGATAALTLAARHPGRFAAVAAWSGTPAPLWDAEQNVVGLAEDVVSGLADTPVYLWTGVDDDILDWDTLRVFVHGMRAAHPDPDDDDFVWERGEGDHGYGHDGPARGLRFLKSHKLVHPP